MQHTGDGGAMGGCGTGDRIVDLLGNDRGLSVVDATPQGVREPHQLLEPHPEIEPMIVVTHTGPEAPVAPLSGIVVEPVPDALDAGGGVPPRTTVEDLPVRVSVVIPALNEAKNLPAVLSRLPHGLHQVILVDGRSVDETIEVARSLRSDIEVVLQGRRGKGNALAHGFAAVTGEVVIMLDADGSADPGEIPAFVAALLAGADFAKGSRFRVGGGSSDITLLRRSGNFCLSALVNVLFQTRYTDLCYGYNAFWTRLLPAFDLPDVSPTSVERVWGDGFEIETLLNLRVAMAGAQITEVASFEHPRLHGVSNLNTIRDGTRVLRTILSERLSAHNRRMLRGSAAPAHLQVTLMASEGQAAS